LGYLYLKKTSGEENLTGRKGYPLKCDIHGLEGEGGSRIIKKVMEWRRDEARMLGT